MPRAAVTLDAATAALLLAASGTPEVRIGNPSAGVLYIRFARGSDATGDDVTDTAGTYDVAIPEGSTYIFDGPNVNVWGYKTAGGAVNVSTGHG